MGDWSELPNDILELITDRLLFLPDVLRFASVCKSWSLIALEKRHHLCHRPPLLMLTYEEDSSTCNFIHISNKEIYKLHLPELRNKWFCGSSHGWLITLDDELEMSLLNPFSRVQIKLPPHPMFPDIIRVKNLAGEKSIWKYNIIHKVMLSDDPISNPNCYIMAIVSDQAECTFCRPGDSTWISFRIWVPIFRRFREAAVLDGKIYGLYNNTMGVVFDTRTLSTVQVLSSIPRTGPGIDTIEYLVKSEDDILYVLRYWKIISDDEDGQEHYEEDYEEEEEEDDDEDEDFYEDDDEDEVIFDRKPFCRTFGFKIYKLEVRKSGSGCQHVNGHDEVIFDRKPFYRTFRFKVYKLEVRKSGSGCQWTEVKSLGDRALFLGRGHSLPIRASDSQQCKANCIYFLDDNFEFCMKTNPRCSDVGIFNMTDGSIEPLPVAPVWPTPTVWLSQDTP